MNEKIIEISDVNPGEFFGPGNSTISQLKKYYPKLKIVSRGNKIKVYGEDDQLDEFEKKIDLLVKYFDRFNKLDENSIEQLLLISDADNEKLNSSNILVHGVGGKRIKAQSPNQQKMVDLMKKNDMLFAVGPAGTGKTYTAVALAVRALKNKEVKRIILTRPAVEAGENLGF